MQIHLKRIYDEPSPKDGKRILVDRLWPRGITKQQAQIDFWFKEIAPSTELRQWYHHDLTKWTEFKKKYVAQLKDNPQQVKELLNQLTSTVTLLFSSKDEKYNNAVVLKEFLEMNL